MQSSVACPAVQFSYTLPYKRHEFGEGGHKMCVFIFSASVIRNTLRRIQRDIINVHGLPVILAGFYRNLNFLGRFSKKIKYQISWKSVRWDTSYLTKYTCDVCFLVWTKHCNKDVTVIFLVHNLPLLTENLKTFQIGCSHLQHNYLLVFLSDQVTRLHVFDHKVVTSFRSSRYMRVQFAI